LAELTQEALLSEGYQQSRPQSDLAGVRACRISFINDQKRDLDAIDLHQVPDRFSFPQRKHLASAHDSDLEARCCSGRAFFWLGVTGFLER
jgi:hypothetical protein